MVDPLVALEVFSSLGFLTDVMSWTHAQHTAVGEMWISFHTKCVHCSLDGQFTFFTFYWAFFLLMDPHKTPLKQPKLTNMAR